MTELEYWLWFDNIKDIWYGKKKKILKHLGTPNEVYYSSEKRIKSLNLLNDKEINCILKSKESYNIEKEMEYLLKNDIQFITCNSECYPEKLKLIDNPPLCLYVRGEIPSKNYSVAIVGARGCSDYGRQIAKKIGKELALEGVDIISGMARGVDTYAHIGCLECGSGGKTFAVLGCGIDICYPIENIELYNEIIMRGGIVSEYSPKVPPLGWRFPQRNRIISGLSDCIIVVEAKRKSGSLITAELALEQGKDVMVVPGRVTDSLSEGCNKLISEGAQIITNIEDILNYMGIRNAKKNINSDIILEKEFEVVYSETDLLPVSFQEIIDRTGMSSEQVFSILLELQLRNLIYEPVKNYYVRKI